MGIFCTHKMSKIPPYMYRIIQCYLPLDIHVMSSPLIDGTQLQKLPSWTLRPRSSVRSLPQFPSWQPEHPVGKLLWKSNAARFWMGKKCLPMKSSLLKSVQQKGHPHLTRNKSSGSEKIIHRRSGCLGNCTFQWYPLVSSNISGKIINSLMIFPLKCGFYVIFQCVHRCLSPENLQFSSGFPQQNYRV